MTWEITELRCTVLAANPHTAMLESHSEPAPFTLRTTLDLRLLQQRGAEADVEMRVRRDERTGVIAEGEITGVHVVVEGSAFEAWRDWARSAGVGADYEYFMGPCAHGRDPYDRCDICGELEPWHAKAVALAHGVV